MLKLFDLTGRTAIVTGSSRGIGRAIAQQLAEAGANVVVSSRKAEACQAVADEITGAGGVAAVIPCNIAEKDQVEALVSRTVERFGGVDILVCNAASNPVFGPMSKVDDDAFDKIMGTNVRSNFWLSNLCAPLMAEKGKGSIIIVSSISGMFGNKMLGVYGISKAADFELARNLAVEWGKKGVRANCIAPGLVKTDFAKALWENPQAAAYIDQMTPLGRIGEPQDIAGVALMLAADAGQFMTGETVVVDGGAVVRDMFP